mmetsp:Transcript_24690/g.78040  ORF Transcript_24690/g.78040 Transcript_24690/m.78040 type:complete len:283 (-) Transcript_24690:936-1784(-)
MVPPGTKRERVSAKLGSFSLRGMILVPSTDARDHANRYPNAALQSAGMRVRLSSAMMIRSSDRRMRRPPLSPAEVEFAMISTTPASKNSHASQTVPSPRKPGGQGSHVWVTAGGNSAGHGPSHPPGRSSGATKQRPGTSVHAISCRPLEKQGFTRHASMSTQLSPVPEKANFPPGQGPQTVAALASLEHTPVAESNSPWQHSARGSQPPLPALHVATGLQPPSDSTPLPRYPSGHAEHSKPLILLVHEVRGSQGHSPPSASSAQAAHSSISSQPSAPIASPW